VSWPLPQIHEHLQGVDTEGKEDKAVVSYAKRALIMQVQAPSDIAHT
jgi:hypothetical protein